MGRQRVPVQLNQYIGGLNTEANPIGYPINATIDEQNVSLLKDGSRRRRLGFDLEESYQEVDTGIPSLPSVELGRNQFLWENPGGFSSRQFVVVQLGNYIGVHDLDNTTVSSAPLYTKTFTSATYSNTYDFAVVDGVLVVATGEQDIWIIKYDGTSFSGGDRRLTIRDLFGVDSGIGAYNGGANAVYSLSDPQYASIRPENLESTHLYNLRNQTFALPRRLVNSTSVVDMVARFHTETGNDLYPSNNDSTVPFIFPDSQDSSNRTIDRFNPEDMVETKPPNSPAPKGYFIIDALNRGTSRRQAESQLRQENPQLSLGVTDLPLDSSPDGAKVLAQYAGRIWYAGFSATLEDGDRLSPRLSSYVLFSQLVNDPEQITNCYQEADPTSNIDSNLVETDGGFIKLDGAYNIRSMVEVQNSLFVFADNGVWQITGDDQAGFVATSYRASRLSKDGVAGPSSVIPFEQSILYWSDSGIFAVEQVDAGFWSTQNITRDTIQTLYNDIGAGSKSRVSGYYDRESDSFRWLHGNNLISGGDVEELVFNTKFKAFTKNKLSSPTGVFGPVTIGGVERFLEDTQVPITSDGIIVTSDSEDVTVGRASTSRGLSVNLYLVVLKKDPTITYTFGDFIEESSEDWASLGTGIDTPAYLTSGPITGGDPRLQKEVPYLTTYFSRTEGQDLGDVESSCFASSRWDWSSSVDTGRWSTPRQMYRPKWGVEGNDLLVTRNRIRGRGHAVSFHFESEEFKTFRLYGWQHNLETGTEE